MWDVRAFEHNRKLNGIGFVKWHSVQHTATAFCFAFENGERKKEKTHSVQNICLENARKGESERNRKKTTNKRARVSGYQISDSSKVLVLASDPSTQPKSRMMACQNVRQQTHTCVCVCFCVFYNQLIKFGQTLNQQPKKWAATIWYSIVFTSRIDNTDDISKTNECSHYARELHFPSVPFRPVRRKTKSCHKFLWADCLSI